MNIGDCYTRSLLYQIQQTDGVSLENSKGAFSVDKCKLIFYDYICKRKERFLMYQEISDAEWEVMRVVWTLEQAYTSDISAALKEKKDWSESTIKTLIRRLVKKGLLSSKKDGRKFIYSPLVSENQMINQSSEKLLAKMCDMHKGAAILKLLQDSPISKSDLMKIEKELQRKLKTAPEVVPCNCIDQKMC